MPTATRTFRVFVSSTFEDLKAERDALQRDVFPRLRKLCEENNARFQAIDLRWGVRDEAALDQQTMEICLREIERCQQTGIKPNFIVLLGERYGWRPLPARIETGEFNKVRGRAADADQQLIDDWYERDDNAVPPEFLLKPRTGEFADKDRWGEIEQRLHRILREAAREAGLAAEELIKYEASATHQEILKGLGHSEDDRKHVFAFFRESVEGATVDAESPAADLNLEALKEDLRQKLPEGNVRPFQIGEIEKLCRDVEESLKKVILDETGRFTSRDALELEIEAHDRFAEDRCRIFVGRGDVLTAISDYLSGPERRQLVLHGESGSGKSAVMAMASRHYKGPGQLIRRFIGASPESASGHALLTSICKQIAPGDMPVDFYKLEKAFQERLSTATVEHPLVLFVDALDQLSGGDPAREARWLPPELPPHVKVIVSTIDDGQLLPGGLQVRLQRMATSEGGEAMAALLHEARRTLQPWQREKVLAHFKRWGLPLYMKLAAEECRLWKSFSRPEACMLGEGISGVLDSLFERLASNANHGSAMVERSLGYLAAARYGLTEDEMLDILAKDDAVWNDFDNRKYHKVSERRLPLVVWSRLSLDLEPYLTERVAPGGTVIAFFHRRIAEWSVSHYPSGAEKHVRHGDLARYFLEMPAWLDDDRKTPNARRAVELPFQQREAEKWNEAQSTLLDCQFLFAKVAAELVLDLDADYRVLLAVRQDETLRLIHGALLLSMNVVLKEGRQYASQMVGRLMGLKGRDALTKFVAELTSTAPRPWLRPMRAGLKPPGGALIRSLGSHAQRVNSVSILNDGSVAASGGQDGVLQLHRLKDQEIQFLSGHTDEINTVLVSRIGEELVAISGAGKRLPFKLMIQLKGFVERTDSRASRDNTIRVWNVADGTLRHTLEGHTAAVRSLASRSRLLLSGSDDGTIRMWDLQEGKSLGILGSQGAPVVLLVMRPEALAVVAFSEYDFQLWDINERRGSGKSHFDYYWQNVLALEPEPMLVALQDTSASGYAYRLKIWDIGNSSDGREIFSTIDSFKHSFNYAQFVNGGKEILVGGTDHIIRLYNIASAEELGQYSRHNSEVTSLAVAEETGNIVSGAADGEILLWNLNCREQPDRPEGHSDDVNSVAVSPDGFTATSACQDGSAIVWSAPSASLIWTFFAGGRLPVRCTAISGDGRLAAFGSDDGTISVRETESGTELVRLVGHEKLVSCVAFCEGDTGIISGSMDKTVRVWKIKDPSKVQVFEGHEEGIRALACSNRGVIAVSGDDSGQLIVWDVVNGGQQRKLDAFYDPAELERSTRALWAVATGPEWPAIPGVQNAPCIESLALSPDDRWLIIGQRNRPIVVLDLVSDSERLKLVGHTGMVLGLSVTAGGRRLVSAADDRSMRVWDLSNGSCIAAFTADRPLYSCAADAAGDLLVAGEGANSGMVHFLSLVEEGDSSVS